MAISQARMAALVDSGQFYRAKFNQMRSGLAQAAAKHADPELHTLILSIMDTEFIMREHEHAEVLIAEAQHIRQTSADNDRRRRRGGTPLRAMALPALPAGEGTASPPLEGMPPDGLDD